MWSEIEPVWLVLRTFRDRAGFHEDKPRRFFEARGGVISRVTEVSAAVQKFEQLFKRLLKAEHSELPELGCVLEDFLGELDDRNVRHEGRAQFKKHYMFPEADGSKVSATE